MVSGGLPVLGHMLEMLRSRNSLFARGHAEHGDVFAIKLGPQRVAIVTGAEHNKQLYLENGWTDASGKLQPSLGNGFDENTGFSNLELLVSDGELVLLGAQTIRGAHKLDELATLKTAWRYDGQSWAVESVLLPLQGVSVTPEFLTPLYYNPDGGLMFHLDFACPAVNERYLPLRRIEEGDGKAAALKPCPYCAYLYVSR